MKFKKFFKNTILMLVVALLTFPVLTLAACNKKDNIVSYEICDEFKDLHIVVGDQIDLSDYEFTIFYESGKKETLAVSDVEGTMLYTETSGDHSFFVFYQNNQYSFTYHVSEPEARAITYKDDPLTFYLGETPTFEGVFVWVIFDNGERKLSLANYTHTPIDYTLGKENAKITFAVEGLAIDIPYSVTCRPIAFDTRYPMSESREAEIVENDGKISLMVYSLRENGEQYVSNTTTLTAIDYNRYTYMDIVDSQVKIFYLYLENNVLVCEEA